MRLDKNFFLVGALLSTQSELHFRPAQAMASSTSSAQITASAPHKLAVYGLGQFGFAMTELFASKHPLIPVEAYDPVTVRS